MLTNFSNEPLTITKSTVVRVAEPILESLVNNANTEMQNDTLKKKVTMLYFIRY
jgi:hypothetical protein